jgi:hypothetical protein
MNVKLDTLEPSNLIDMKVILQSAILKANG